MPIKYDPKTGLDIHALYLKKNSYADIAKLLNMKRSLVYKKHRQFVKWVNTKVGEPMNLTTDSVLGYLSPSGKLEHLQG